MSGIQGRDHKDTKSQSLNKRNGKVLKTLRAFVAALSDRLHGSYLNNPLSKSLGALVVGGRSPGILQSELLTREETLMIGRTLLRSGMMEHLTDIDPTVKC